MPFRVYQTWYRIVGAGEDPGKFPLLCLHGGPSAGHDYLESLQAMADTGRRVIFYDQLGCGRWSIPESKPEMWTVDLYVDEVNALREELALDRIHLLGQSWGQAGDGICPHSAPRVGESNSRQLAGQHDPVGRGGQPAAGGSAARRAGHAAPS
ncbi:MAG: alpha/beta fold hydrolase [Chloroflexi bacterium]|nr:alpha/beta fold hydrolase [Chloroflexota bacterium]